MTFYAFYSHQASERVGGVVEYLREDGTPVVCTYVTEDENGEGYEWDDKSPLGRVENFNRIIIPMKLD